MATIIMINTAIGAKISNNSLSYHWESSIFLQELSIR